VRISSGGNRILRAHLPPRQRLTDPQRSTLAKIGKAGAFAVGGSSVCGQARHHLGLVSSAPRAQVRWLEEPSVSGPLRAAETLEALIVRMARENSGWGYDRIVGALANPGHKVSDQTVENILKR
jgi:hypothetical protein